MYRPIQFAAISLLLALSAGPAWAQRPFAPDVLKVIPAMIDVEVEETETDDQGNTRTVKKLIQRPAIDGRDIHSLPMPIPGLDAPEYVPEVFPESETLYSATRQVVMVRDVFQFEFAFLPLRQMVVEARSPDGQVRRVNVWYLVYRVRNVGATISHEAVQDPKFGHIDYVPREGVDELGQDILHQRFFGNFTLAGWVQEPRTWSEEGVGADPVYTRVEYQNKTLPAIHARIAAEEDLDQEYLDSVQIAQEILEKYPADSGMGGKWGIAIWYNVDPRLDFVTVKVSGLSNAFRLETGPDGSIQVRHKVLQLNFWRPGDSIDEADDEIVYGIPLVDDSADQAEYARRYQLPGPVIRCESVNPDNLRKSILFETDAELDPETFDSAVAAQLDEGVIPPSVQEGFTNAGSPLGGDASIQTDVKGQRWTIRDTWEGVERQFSIMLYPEFWEKTIDGKIRMIKRLDHLWLYE